MAIILDGVVSGPTGYLNGAHVDAWLASRFTSTPGAGDPPPAGQPDAGPVLSGTTYGGPGQWRMEVPSVSAYYVRVTYPVGATNAKSYWAYDDSLVLTTGPQGVQGAQGSQGTQGTQGNQGLTGARGVQGSVGFTGPQGFQGSQGAQGNMGAQGVQGTQGTQGYQGFQGLTGPQGTQGAPSTVQGPQGYQGFQGLTGPQGNQGVIGNTGARGPQGEQGLTGPQGTQGYQGDLGNQGAQGYQGTQGVQGVQGHIGQTGPQGPQGFVGNQGPQGFGGPQGFQGNQGNQGPQGSQGNQGPQGVQGAGIPTGGTTGQALIKNSNVAYDIGWQSQLPLSGGTMSGAIAMGSQRITGLPTAGASTDVARADSSIATPNPSIHSGSNGTIKAWNADPANSPAFSSNTQTMASGVQFFSALSIPFATTLTYLWVYQTTGAVAGASGAYYAIGIYDTSGNLLASTGNQVASGFIGLTGALPWTLTSTYNIAAGNYMVGFIWYQGTGGTPTTPVLGKPSAAVSAGINLACPTPSSGKLDQRACSAGTGRTTIYSPMNTTPTAGAGNFWTAVS